MIRELYTWLKNTCAAPSAEALALKELEESKRSILEAQTSLEYADSMCKFHEAKIKRLTAYLHSATKEQP